MNNKLAYIYIRRDLGFFSDFLTSLAGIKYCYDNEYDFHIDWFNSLYQTENAENLFDKFFFQKQINKQPDMFYYNLTPYGYQFTDIANETCKEKMFNFLKPFSDLIKNLNILNTNFFKKIPNYFENKKVLGFHKRGTDHVTHGDILSDDYFASKIDKELNNCYYDNIFMITDDFNSLNFFKKRYGNFLISTDSMKSDSQIGVHHLPNNFNKHKLASEAILDSYILSLTEKKLITKSNLSTFSILCNLKIDNFEFVDNCIHYRHC